MRGPKVVKALDNSPSNLLDRVYDAKTGRYLVPSNLPRRSVRLRALTWLFRIFARGSRVAIVDTGMLSRHPWLRKRIVGAVDFTGEGPEDQNGHGTAVALVFVASDYLGSKLLNVKVLDKDKVGTKEDLIEGLRWAEQSGATLINLSLGVSQDCAGDCDVCREATRITGKGILIVAAAGNEGPTCPARAEGVIASGGSPTVTFAPLRS